jgi:hypothetical protein
MKLRRGEGDDITSWCYGEHMGRGEMPSIAPSPYFMKFHEIWEGDDPPSPCVHNFFHFLFNLFILIFFLLLFLYFLVLM